MKFFLPTQLVYWGAGVGKEFFTNCLGLICIYGEKSFISEKREGFGYALIGVH